tara:strand:- start:298 stop:921 length:624 start_codon:yes stop_codon:yes gene_type:complete
MKILNKNQIVKDVEGIKVIDNFFTNECLQALRYRMLFSKYYDRKYEGYVATDYYPTKDLLTDLIVNEIENKFDLPKFLRAWSFLYTENNEGVPFHCDSSIKTFNTWVSLDESVLDSEKNGLHIYKITPPDNWTINEWNGDKEKSLEYIKSKKIDPIKISYKSNRAILFDGSYFHKTNGVSMKEGFENMRISYTLLFGNGLEQTMESK